MPGLDANENAIYAHIAGSPFEVFIDIAQNTDPASVKETYAEGDGLKLERKDIKAGLEQKFKIQAVDNRKENKGLGGDKFEVFILPASENDMTKNTTIERACTDYNIGIYYCKYVWPTAEKIKIYVRLQGIENQPPNPWWLWHRPPVGRSGQWPIS